MAKARQEEPVLPKLSMGYAIFDPEYLTPQEAIEEADQMMYRVKQSRKKAEQAK
jgi:GGDEF domain-containing protein